MRRLEAERRRAGSAALRAQEEERARVARDLHDEVNQSLTGLLLRLEAVREAAPPELEPELAETRALANQAMQELLSLARQLRPTALDDLGLAAAIAGQLEQVERSGLTAELSDRGRLLRPRRRRAAGRLPGRPGGADQRRPPQRGAADRGEPAPGRRRGVELEISDDGRGFAFEQSERGLGIGGMRERALLIGGRADDRVAARATAPPCVSRSPADLVACHERAQPASAPPCSDSSLICRSDSRTTSYPRSLKSRSLPRSSWKASSPR